MLAIPDTIEQAYTMLLRQRKMTDPTARNYKKWLRFYLDFCHKYHYPPGDKQSQHAFNDKLIEKQQSREVRSEAWQAVNFCSCAAGTQAGEAGCHIASRSGFLD